MIKALMLSLGLMLTTGALMVSDAAWVAIPPTIAAFGALVVGIITVLKTSNVHKLVNSQLTNVKTELKTANEHIKTLQELVKIRNGERRPPPSKEDPR